MLTTCQELINAFKNVSGANTIFALTQATEAAKQNIEKIKQDKTENSQQAQSSANSLKAILDEYTQIRGGWIDELHELMPKTLLDQAQKKQLKKHLVKSIELIAAQKKIEVETAHDVIKEINRSKKLSQLNKLAADYALNSLTVADTSARFDYIAVRKINEIKQTRNLFQLDKLNIGYKKGNSKNPKIPSKNEWSEYITLYKNKIEARTIQCYQKKLLILQKKKYSDWLALGLSIVISAGVGFIGGVAIMLILPTMGLSAFIPIFAFFAIAAGFTEGLVYHPYNKKFCRSILVNGFFEKIEHNIFNREAKKMLRKDRHDLTPREKKRIFKATHTEIRLKKLAAIIAIPVAIATGFGFAALIFTHIVTFLGLVGITGGMIIPIVIALIIGSIYAAVMYSMIYSHIKKDTFTKIKNELQHIQWSKLVAKDILKGIIMAIGLALILAIAITATVFTAGAWLNSSLTFFHLAIGLTVTVSNKIAKGIAAVMFVTTAWFNFENSIKTAKMFVQVQWRKLPHRAVKLLKQPKKLILALLNFIPFVVHVAATGAVAVQGASPAGGLFEKIFGGSNALITEVLVDSHAVLGHGHHEHGDHCDHNHDIAGTVAKKIKKWFGGIFKTKNPEMHATHKSHSLLVPRQSYATIGKKLAPNDDGEQINTIPIIEEQPSQLTSITEIKQKTSTSPLFQVVESTGQYGTDQPNEFPTDKQLFNAKLNNL